MGLRELPLKLAYESEESRTMLLDEFYIPALEQATKYYRIAGFFSSAALAIAAKGIEGLIHNGGKMYLLVSPELSEEDLEIIQTHHKVTEDCSIFSALDLTHSVHENTQALAWLLDCGRLEIKIVVSKKSARSLFHEKIGILCDTEENRISFSGSINESAQAWLHNIEEFKVFRSWVPGQADYLQADLKKFLDFWKGKKTEIADVYDVPESIKKKIIRCKPRDVKELSIMRRYQKETQLQKNKLSLFPHQVQAVEKWLSHDCRLLMEMATGTGKTRTAIGCMLRKLQELRGKESLLVIVATPQNTLSRQWAADMKSLGIEPERTAMIDGSNPKWKKDLELLLLDFYEKKIQNAVIFATHDTASSAKFIQIIQKNKYKTKILFICDEVHAIGSAHQREALLELYDYRIGLSATPERMYDREGTSLIRDFFGDDSFQFTIADALWTVNPLTGKPFLNHFDYFPIFVSLTEEEQKKYKKLSMQIYMEKNAEHPDEKKLERFYMNRANIMKNAENKYPAFESLLEKMEPGKIRDTILFVSDKQMEPCFVTMSRMGIKRAKITEEESATKIVNKQGETERQQIISQFIEGYLQVLAGIKCLDEGIDITSARVAILMASSTNPREYVQRVGRVIRPGKPGQEKARSEIYDLIVDTEEINALEREGRRVALIARNADNYDFIRQEFLRKGVNLDAYQQ